MLKLGSSGVKRKAARNAVDRTLKKTRTDSSSEEVDSSDHEPDSDFELDDSEDESEQSDSEDVEADDYNPFGGSDNEDPWCRSSKNGNKRYKLEFKK